jgi:protein O-mannosyl-transferase
MVGAMLLLTAIACARSLSNDFVFDDEYNILANPYLGQWSFLSKALYRDAWWFIDPGVRSFSAFYRPVWLIWYWLNYQLFGDHPVGWHLSSVLLHLVAVWLVYRIAEHLTGEFEPALLAALLFGLLPCHADVLGWPAAVDIPLVATFELAAFLAFLEHRNKDRIVSWPVLLLYAGALLSHESAIVFPALVALYLLTLESPPGEVRLIARLRLVMVYLLPLVAETMVYLIVHELVIGSITRPPSGDHLTIAQALMTAPGALAIYLQVLMVPWAAGPAHRLLPPASLAALLIPAAIVIAVAGAFALAIRNSSRRNFYLFCAGWMAITFAPAMNLPAFRIDMVIQDRYLYLASVGWCLMLATALVGLAVRGLARQLVWAVVGALLIVYGAALWSAQHLWHDDATLFRRGVEEFPEAALWHAQLGVVLARRHDLTGAVHELETWRSLTRDLRTYEGSEQLRNLGLAYAQLGRNREAETELAQSIQFCPDAPASAYVTLAGIYEGEGNLAGAERTLKTKLALDPDDDRTLYQLGRLHARMGRVPEAVAEISAAVKLAPHPPAEACTALAELYDIEGDRESSESALRKAESMPDATEEVGIMRARIAMRHGDKNGAENALRDVAARYPADQHVWTMLGLMMADQKRDDDALVSYQHAIGLKPHDPRPYLFAARLLHAKGRDREALDDCHQALAIDPNDADAASLMNDLTRSSEQH